MTDPVSGASSIATSSATTTVDRPGQMGSDTFLKLLVAEMKYQDPSKPMDSAQMMAQTATLTQTQALQTIADQNKQTLALQLGGKVEGGHAREFGRADVEIKEPSALYDGVWEIGQRYPVWMSHGDRVTELPPGFKVASERP